MAAVAIRLPVVKPRLRQYDQISWSRASMALRLFLEYSESCKVGFIYESGMAHTTCKAYSEPQQ